jgi:hypothetical protein
MDQTGLVLTCRAASMVRHSHDVLDNAGLCSNPASSGSESARVTYEVNFVNAQATIGKFDVLFDGIEQLRSHRPQLTFDVGELIIRQPSADLDVPPNVRYWG